MNSVWIDSYFILFAFTNIMNIKRIKLEHNNIKKTINLLSWTQYISTRSMWHTICNLILSSTN